MALHILKFHMYNVMNRARTNWPAYVLKWIKYRFNLTITDLGLCIKQIVAMSFCSLSWHHVQLLSGNFSSVTWTKHKKWLSFLFPQLNILGYSLLFPVLGYSLLFLGYDGVPFVNLSKLRVMDTSCIQIISGYFDNIFSWERMLLDCMVPVERY